MKPSVLSPAFITPKGRDGPDAPHPKFGRVARKSALLNLGIVLTALPVLALSGGLNGLPASLAVLAAVSIVLWTATFAVFSFASLFRIFRAQGVGGTRRRSRSPGRRDGVADDWLDGPALGADLSPTMED